jgi:hypothetical protein
MFPITGKLRERFVQVAVLLHQFDPVRGEPTIHGLNQDPHEVEAPRERLLKRKFLDSFALICATEKDGDSVSATCMEEDEPQGTIIRVASNAGVRASTLTQLRQVLNLLNSFSDSGRCSGSSLHEWTFLIIISDRYTHRRNRGPATHCAN